MRFGTYLRWLAFLVIVLVAVALAIPGWAEVAAILIASVALVLTARVRL